MENTITALIFDLDGTLIDTMPAHYKAWCEAVAAYHQTVDKNLFYSMAGWPTIKVAEVIMDHCGRPEDPQIIAKRKEALFFEHIDEVTPISPTVELVHKYSGRLPMAIATGSLAYQADRLLNKLGIKERFQVILTADDGLPPKPQPDIFLEAARRLRQPPQNCLVLEDGDAGLKGARTAGMASLDVRTPVNSWQPLLQRISLI